MTHVFSSTDRDGDTLNVERISCKNCLTDFTFTKVCANDTFVITITGEDGHRSVILSDNDLARLTEALAQTAPIHR